MARFPARYYDGLTAQSQPVEVEIAATGLAIFEEAEPVVGSWPGEGVQLAEKPLEGEPVRLGLAGATALLIVDDPEIVPALERTAPHLRHRQRTSGKAVARVALWVALAAGSLVGIVLVLIPLLSVQLAAVTPDSAKYGLGRTVLVHLVELLPDPRTENVGRYCSNEWGVATLERLVERLGADLEDRPAVHVVVVNSRMVNAFALPGGIMVFTSSLLAEAGSAEKIAGIAAHELGHHRARPLHPRPLSVLRRIASGRGAAGRPDGRTRRMVGQYRLFA